MDFTSTHEEQFKALLEASAEVYEAKLILNAISSSEGVNSKVSDGEKYSGCTVFHLAIMLEPGLAITTLKWLGGMDSLCRDTIHSIGQYWMRTSLYSTGSVLHCAVRPTPDLKIGNPDVVRAVLDLPFVDSDFIAMNNKGGYNAVFVASLPPEESNTIIDIMITKEGFATALNARTSTGGSIFQWIVEQKDPGCWKVVVAFGATDAVSDSALYGYDQWGQCSLYWAGQKGHLDAAQALLDIPGYDLMKHLRLLNIPDEKGRLTPCRGLLVGNIHSNNSAFLDLVINHSKFDTSFFEERDGFDEKEDEGGKTLVEHAVARGALECLAVLFKRGAKVTMHQLLPALCGSKHVPSLVDSLKAKIKTRFEEDFERAGPGTVEVIAVEHNVASEVLGKHLQAELFKWTEAHYKQSPTLRFLWHASAVPDIILSQGVNNNFSNMSMNVYGVGVYFASDAKLANAYSRPDDDGVYTVICALTMLGDVGVKEPLVLCEVETTETDELSASMKALGVDLTQPQHRNPPIGCDTTTGPHRKEIVIYNNAGALPLFSVKYKLLCADKLENPYVADTLSRRGDISINSEYLRSLDQVPALLNCEGEIHIDDNAKLMPMGTFPVTRGEVIKLKQSILSGEFVVPSDVTSSSTPQKLWAECQKLRAENEWLKAEMGRLQLVEADNQKLKIGIERL
jgi:hypothetical protein